ncbi:hypothetical protein FYK55_16705 [Roseiconus nitratireducens]|uniref:Uncharacterized protein n=1 Tax=Roseiconus nitratireducens TaxID=2605748 RepID=A0A5M6D3D2_9BACT|nr:hypothetical protein [Roseiconus nitratireducens]KAA5541843.1 hypothetical protein FYK55_16705 [Roseiconus nitratireducens]
MSQRLLGVACLVLIGAGMSPAQFLPIELRAVSRSGAQVGSTVEMRVVAGDRLDEVNQLLFSHPGISAEVKTGEKLPLSESPEVEYGSFRVQVAEEVPPGRYEVRAVGRHGVSNARAFLVSERPTAEVAASHDPRQPTPLARDTWATASTSPEALDYYAVELTRGKSVRVDLLAQRLDSKMLGYLKLYDPQHRLVAVSRGADGFDPILEYLPETSGIHVLAVHDVLYHGGPEHLYQLLVRDLPAEELVLADLGKDARTLPRVWTPESITAESEGGIDEPADPAAQVQTLSVPHEGTYWFAPKHGENLFEFPAEANQVVAIDVISHRLGEPTDGRLTVQKVERLAVDPSSSDPDSSSAATYHDLATVDDLQAVGDAAVRLRTSDPGLTFTAPASATYRLVLQDLDVGETLRQRQWYRLRLTEPNPGFDLVAYRSYPHRDASQSKPFGTKLFRGGAETIQVFVLRRDGWAGAVEVVAEGLPDGVQCAPIVIAKNQNQACLTLVAAEDAGAARADIRVVGTSVDDSHTSLAVPVCIVHARGAGRDFVRSRITSSLPVFVSADDLSPISLHLSAEATPKVKQGETLKLPVTVTRREGGQAVCLLRPRDLPPGVSAAEFSVAADKTDATVELKVAAGAAVGHYSIWMQGETKVKIQPNPQRLARAQAYRQELQELQDDPNSTQPKEALQAAVARADQEIEAAKNAAKEQEITAFVPTNVVTFEVTGAAEGS